MTRVQMATLVPKTDAKMSTNAQLRRTTARHGVSTLPGAFTAHVLRGTTYGETEYLAMILTSAQRGRSTVRGCVSTLLEASTANALPGTAWVKTEHPAMSAPSTRTRVLALTDV